MNKFFNPPISIEKFAAFLDGNLPQAELEQISSLIETNHELLSLAETSEMLDEDIVHGCDIPDEIFNNDFELPSVDLFQNDIEYDDVGNMFLEIDTPDIEGDDIFDEGDDGDIDL